MVVQDMTHMANFVYDFYIQRAKQVKEYYKVSMTSWIFTLEYFFFSLFFKAFSIFLPNGAASQKASSTHERSYLSTLVDLAKNTAKDGVKTCDAMFAS